MTDIDLKAIHILDYFNLISFNPIDTLGLHISFNV